MKLLKTLKTAFALLALSMIAAVTFAASAGAAGWSQYEDLGGQLTSGPSAGVQNITGHPLLTAHRDASGNVSYKWWSASNGWSSFTSLGAPASGPIKGEPAIAGVAGGLIVVAVRGADDQIYINQYYPYYYGWTGWTSFGGAVTSAPAISSTRTESLFNVFARDTNGALVYRAGLVSYNTVQPQGAWQNLGGYITSAPGAASWAQGRIDVFARGGDMGLYHRAWDSTNGWYGWEALGGYLTSAPAVASWGPFRLDVFVRGSDATLNHKAYYPTFGWSSWESLGGGLVNEAGIGAASWGNNPNNPGYEGRLDVFVRGTDDHMWHKAFDW